MGNVSRTFDIPSTETVQDQIPGTLTAIAFGICSAMHTTTRAMPVQLVFGRDSILNVRHVADWKHMQSQKQDVIVKNNIEENKKCKEHAHELNKLVLVKQDWTSKCGTTAHGGPCPITKTNDNGAAQVQMDKILDAINIRQLKPCNA